jgi:hypothetical protein
MGILIEFNVSINISLRCRHHAAICVHTDKPGYSDIPDFDYYLSKTVYRDLKETKPEDTPKPTGNFVSMSHYVEANLMPDIMTGKSVTGKSVTGILHIVKNSTGMVFKEAAIRCNSHVWFSVCCSTN